MAIDFSLSDEQTLIGQTVEDFAKSELRPSMRGSESAGAVSDALRRQYQTIGLDRLLLPEAQGGFGADDRLCALVNERLAWGDAGAAVALAGWEPALLALDELADEAAAELWLKRVAALSESPSWGAVAFSESLGDGLPDSGLGCRAERVDGGYRLHGRKAFVTQADGAALTIVVAQTDSGLGAFAFQGRPDGLSITSSGRRTGLQAAPLYDLELAGVVLPEVSRLSAGDVSESLRRFFARVALQQAARCVGVMQAAWTYARDYAAEREAFGKPIAHFQAIAFMLADMATLTDATRWSVWRAAAAFDAGAESALRDGLCAVANAWENALRVTEDAVQILGGAGFVEDYPAEKWMREARALTLGWATAEQVRAALGHELLGTAPSASSEDLLPMPQAQPIST